MRKLVESTFVTLDGVISDPAAWGAPYWNDEHANYARELLFAADALLLGRATYEGFAKPGHRGAGTSIAIGSTAFPSTWRPPRYGRRRGTRL